MRNHDEREHYAVIDEMSREMNRHPWQYRHDETGDEVKALLLVAANIARLTDFVEAIYLLMEERM